jgi:hypothetical protein
MLVPTVIALATVMVGPARGEIVTEAELVDVAPARLVTVTEMVRVRAAPAALLAVKLIAFVPAPLVMVAETPGCPATLHEYVELACEETEAAKLLPATAVEPVVIVETGAATMGTTTLCVSVAWRAFVALQVSVTEPDVPAVKVMAFVVALPVMLPPVAVHEYVNAADGAVAVSPVAPDVAAGGAAMAQFGTGVIELFAVPVACTPAKLVTTTL